MAQKRLEDYLVKFGTFDETKLSFTDAYERKPKNGMMTIRSDPVYTVDGVNYNPMFELCPQSIPGVYESRKFQTEIVNGYQVAFTVKSKDGQQTPEQQEVQNLVETIERIAKDRIKMEVAKGKNSKVPSAQRAVFKQSMDENIDNDGLKPNITSETNKKGEPVAPKWYVKLDTFGEGDDMKTQTKFYGPDNNEVNIMTCVATSEVAKPATLHPVISLRGGIYYGAHGQTPYAGSLQFRIYEANYTPGGSFGRKRLIASQPAQSTQSSSRYGDFDGNDGNEDDGPSDLNFTRTGRMDSRNELNNIVRKNQSDTIRANPEGEDDDEPQSQPPAKTKTPPKVETEKPKKKKVVAKKRNDDDDE